MAIKENLAKLTQEIESACQRSNRDPEEITIVAITKYVNEEKTKEVIDSGIKHIGENRDIPFLEKYEAIGEKAIWHFVGTLQSRKVKNVIQNVDYLHSLDRLSLAKEINKRSEKPVNCFVQVNVSGETSKHGLSAEEVIPFIKDLEEFEKVVVIGLMTMAPFSEDEEEVRSVFRKLKGLQSEIMSLNLPHAPCKELSMGMSNDFIIAIEEGATFIRIGSSLVGKERD